MYTKKGERAHAHVCACVCVLHEKSKQGRRDNKRMQPTRHTQSQTEVKDRGKQPDDTATVTRNAREELGRQIERGGGVKGKRGRYSAAVSGSKPIGGLGAGSTGQW